MSQAADSQPARGRTHRHPHQPWRADFYDALKLFSIQLLCGGGAGAVARTAVAPLERVKILLQVQAISSTPKAEQYTGLRDALRRIPLREGGWTALWRGNGANVLRLLPEVGFKFVVHDQLKIMFASPDGSPLGMLEKLAAGAATGALKTTLFYPLDLSRIRITADTSPFDGRNYGSVRHAISATIRHEGFLGLYKGMSLSLISVVPYLSFSFTAYDHLKRILPEDKVSRAQWWYPLAKIGCGASAAVTAQALAYPLDTVRRRMQLNGSLGTAVQYRSTLSCVHSMFYKEGWQSFYRGCLVNCLKTMPGAAIQFVAYDLIKSTMQLLDPTTGVTSPL